jgi:hypothetical protein
MAGVLYKTKSNNEEVKKLLDNPLTGRELVKKIMIGNKVNGKSERSTQRKYTIKSKDEEVVIKVTELGYDISSR